MTEELRTEDLKYVRELIEAILKEYPEVNFLIYQKRIFK